MKRYFAVLAVFLATATKALSTAVDSKHADPFGARPTRFLRDVALTEEVNGGSEERGLMDQLAKKWRSRSSTNNQLHKTWLKEGESPQSLFRQYGWKGKSIEELKLDPNYQRYEGFDELWTLKQQKKGSVLTPEKWAKLMKKEQKKN
ncbi:hypothetical protein PHYSODRAFT_286361 [Phytophthora sojae]|uniref:RxLR effector protein n=1 Tax=Phytophthora sojae (strain P6497) TaxID=1094619 RepID=G4ZNA2_PHYSP|nr:hypothetical protein PHYSODRAFT_286361 [Phytophthora sojae]EGZ15712.1 hypothetical protein PHYSODRAFT_286361 [Phytophthora sojae]|eukprot:XP_009529461.1 hypothetical protein PHYSODRAFT_286361 [Phytophthora sojae]